MGDKSEIRGKRIVAIVGMAGAGKTEAASVFSSSGWRVIRFGQITLDEVKKRGMPVNEASERAVREEFRETYGMAAYAIVNQPTIDQSLAIGPVAIDNLMSWSEYKIMKEKYSTRFFTLAITASPDTRYERLEGRAGRHGADADTRFRSFPRDQARARDFAEIEHIEKGGPIVMADYTVVNEGSLEALRHEVGKFIELHRTPLRG